MELEEIYTILCGASNSSGVKFEVIQRWFIECGIIDEKTIGEDFFAKSFSRLCPNFEELSLTQFVQLIGILCRETKQDVRSFENKFHTVKPDVLHEIQERIRNEAI